MSDTIHANIIPAGSIGANVKEILRGLPGEDGVSPTVTIEDIENGHRIIITDAEGEHSIDVMDGVSGRDGANGVDGKDGKDWIPTESEIDNIAASAAGKVQPSVTELKEAIAQKQDKLTSGTNIKTINGQSVLGSGDISIQGGSGGYDDTEIRGEIADVKEDLSQVSESITEIQLSDYSLSVDTVYFPDTSGQSYLSGFPVVAGHRYLIFAKTSKNTKAQYSGGVRLGLGGNGYTVITAEGLYKGVTWDVTATANNPNSRVYITSSAGDSSDIFVRIVDLTDINAFKGLSQKDKKENKIDGMVMSALFGDYAIKSYSAYKVDTTGQSLLANFPVVAGHSYIIYIKSDTDANMDYTGGVRLGLGLNGYTIVTSKDIYNGFIWKVAANTSTETSRVYLTTSTGSSTGIFVSIIDITKTDSFNGFTFNTVINKALDEIQSKEKEINASCSYGIHSAGVKNANKKLCMLVTTDLHAGIERFSRAIDIINGTDAIDIGCCLGDIPAQNYAESDGTWYTSLVNSCNKKFLTALGNHDGGNTDDLSKAGTVAQTVNKFITPTVGKIGVQSVNGGYYSVDFEQYNITMIVLNDYDTPDTISDGKLAVSRKHEMYSQNQVNWLVNTLKSIPANRTLVVLKHNYTGVGKRYDCNFTSHNRNVGEDASHAAYGRDVVVPNIINAWIKGTSYSATVNPLTEFSAKLPIININADFTSRGTGKFACYLTGHLHWDAVAHDNTFNDQLIIGFDCTVADDWQNANSDLPRVTGTQSIDCLTTVAFDTKNRLINLVRIGSDVTNRMVKRDIISLSY